MNQADFKTTRDGLGDGLAEIGKTNNNVVVVNADLEESTRTHIFKKEFPKRYFQVGVAEQNMMGISAGLALGGKIPFATSFAIFSPGLNWEQIRLACISNLNIKIASTHAGFSNGPDGASHQALEDIALTRVLPNMTVVVPSDYHQAMNAVTQIAEITGPCYLRLSKTPTPILNTDQPFIIGKAQILSQGSDCTIITTGNMIHQSLAAAQQLNQNGLKVGVINLPTIKPLDKKVILEAAQNTQLIVTIEEHQIAGGLGSSITEYLAQAKPIRIYRLGVKNQFGETGTIEELYKKHNLDTQSIVNRITSLFPAK